MNSSYIELFINAWNYIKANTVIGIGLLLFLFGLIMFLSALRVKLQRGGDEADLVLSFAIFVTGLLMATFNDVLIGVLTGIMIVMIHQTYKLRDTPVWKELMIASTITYGFIFLGKVIQMIYTAVTHAPKGDQRIFGLAFNLSFYVFILIAFIFFGKKFILVSRFSSPQMIYLGLFGVVYIVILKTGLRNFDYLHYFSSKLVEKGLISHPVKVVAPYNRILFATFGTFEALLIVSGLLYLISGWMLAKLFGVQPVKDQRVIKLVQETANILGIKHKIKVGHVKAPILNAMAYGPFYDLRVAFISNSLDTFSDDDIKGIVGHELAHAANYHVPLSLLLTAVELGIKKALNLPATTLDYAAFTDNSISFVSYYIFNYGLLVVLLIFVRILEGHADYVTNKAGLSTNLSKALFRLEGYYQGVASDFGISVNLLTDREYTREEKIRFNSEAAVSLYKEIISPTTGAAFGNIFVSHPRTSYRLVAAVNPEISPLKGALLPYLLLLPWTREKYVKIMQQSAPAVKKIINQAYFEDFSKEDLETHLKYWPETQLAKSMINENVIGISPLEKKLIEGKINQVRYNLEDPCSPIIYVVETPDGTVVNCDSSSWGFEIAKVGDIHFDKKGNLGKLLSVEFDSKKGLKASLSYLHRKEKVVKLNYIPKRKELLKKALGENAYLVRGTVESCVISQIKETEKENIKDWRFIFKFKNGKEETFSGNNLVITFPPTSFDFSNINKQNIDEFLEGLKGNYCTIYIKKNFDVPLEGKIVDIKEAHLVMDTIEGIITIEKTQLDYVIDFSNRIEFIEKKSISLLTWLLIWWENRKNFDYLW